MRARHPDREGFADLDGARVFFEVFGVEASLESMLASMVPSEATREQVEAICRRVRAPLLILHGDDDRCQPLARAERLADLTGAPMVVLEGAGHLPMARHPVKVNLLIRNFVDKLAAGG